jgi:predicted dinucleotide-binding enzyme
LVVGGVVALAAPWLAILGVIAGLVTKVRIVVEREVDEDATDTTADATSEPTDASSG